MMIYLVTTRGSSILLNQQHSSVVCLRDLMTT
jgi:hypothetical protein